MSARDRVLKVLQDAPAGGLTVSEIRDAMELPRTTAVARNIRSVLSDLRDDGLVMKHRPLGEPDAWTTTQTPTN